MAQPSIPRCPQCGAALPRVGDGWARRCNFCQADLTLGMPAVPAPAPFPTSPAPHPAVPAQPLSKTLRFVAFAAFLAPVIISLAVFVGTRVGSSNDLSNPFGGTDDFQWDEGERLTVVTLPGQAHEAFVGRIRTNITTAAELHIGLFSGDTFESIWRSPSLGRLTEDGAMQATHVAVAGNRLVVTDFHHNAQLLDLATGRAVATVALSDRARSVCASATGRVWIEVNDERHVLLDPTTGQAALGAMPADCVPSQGRGFIYDCGRNNARPSAECVASDSAVIAGMNTRATVVGPDATLVSFGVRSPGTGVPMVAVTDRARAVRWQRPVPATEVNLAEEGPPDAFDVVGNEVFVSFHRRDRSIRLEALDATTGRTRWETAPPRSEGSPPPSITVGRERVYLPHWTWLDVFDRTTGAHLHTVGRW